VCFRVRVCMRVIRGKPRITETADSEFADAGVRLYVFSVVSICYFVVKLTMGKD
jgi:hypothetical protein